MRRVELVCTMLTTTREPLSQVALACGFSDQAHLCKVFRRTIGMRPSAWRRAMTARYAPCERLHERSQHRKQLSNLKVSGDERDRD
jgi:AraC-like DNA-binding protein